MKSDFSIEIYSTPLIKALHRKFGCFDYGKCYRLVGELIESEKIVVFSLDTLQVNDDI
jgi:hypothetical protein